MVPEVTYGITPANPAFTYVRNTGTTVGLTKDSLVSEELRPDRQIVDHQYGMQQVGGDISAEMNYGTQLDTMLEAVLCGTWTANVLKASTVRRSFSVLRHFSDLATGDKPFHLYNGVEFNTFALSITANDRVTATYGVVGRQQTAPSGTAPAGSTGTTIPTTVQTPMMTGTLTSLSEGGLPLGIATELSFTLENGIEMKPVVASAFTLRPSIGRTNLTGQLTAYFENATLLEKFINGDSSSISILLSDPTTPANGYTILIPRIKYTGGQADVSGQGSITIPLPFQALFNTAQSTNLQITRTT